MYEPPDNRPAGPGPDEGPPGEPLEGPPASRPAGRSFCTGCGAPWDPAWSTCPYCEATRAARAAHQQTARRPVRSVLALYFLLLATNIVGVLIALGSSQDAPARALLVIGVCDTVLVLLWCGLCWETVGPALRRVGRARYHVLAVVGGCASFGVAHTIIDFLTTVLGAESVPLAQPFLDAGWGWPVVILAISIQPAIIEELAFRGLMLGSLHSVMSARQAVVVTACLFAVIHLAPLAAIHLLLIGVLAGALCLRSGALYPCMVLHAVHNSLALLVEAGGW